MEMPKAANDNVRLLSKKAAANGGFGLIQLNF